MNQVLTMGLFSDLRTAIQSMINRACIISYGIIKNIIADGVVEVEISVANNPNDLQIITCVLANIASDVLTVNIQPTVDDKVIVLFPNKYDPEMFDKDKNEVIISENPSGYDMLSGIAILVNQYKEKDHFNLLNVTKGGAIELKLAYDGSDNLLVLTTNKDGELELKANNTKIEVNKDNEINIDTGKAKVTIDKNGNVTIDAMQGKLSLKNSMTSLYDILDGMLQILNTSLATAGSPANHTVVPQQFTAQSMQLSQLME